MNELPDYDQKPQFPGLAESNKNLALVALSKGDAETALRHADEAVALIDKWDFGGPKTKVGQFMRFMRACVLHNVGKIQEALEVNLEVLDERVLILGKSHDHTIDSY